MRSGVFSIGVLQGLNDIGALTNIDIMSSVSGGGYAASWYFIQSINNGFNSDLLFTNSGNYQQYLVNHGELISHFAAQRTVLRRLSYAGPGIETVLTWPVNLIENGIFGWHANVVPLRRIYQSGIDRLYHTSPRPEGTRSPFDFISVGDFTPLLNRPKHIRFEALTVSNLQWRLPFPIVNTTAHVEEASAQDASLLHNTVFEFTPLHYGSDYFGYQSCAFPLDYNRAISISGAAADSKLLREPNQRAMVSVVNADLGYFISNPSANSFARDLRKSLPFPLYPFSEHYQKDFNGDDIYIADGGHSENLGAYSLVRRLCKCIIIVDATHDPHFQFEDYKLLKSAMRAEMGVEFHVAAIDGRTFSGKTPVMQGWISYFPVMDDHSNAINRLDVSVIYIKLSIDISKLSGSGGYDAAIRDYYYRHEHDHNFHGELDTFPQRATTDQSYTPDQVTAYRDLGRYIVTNNAPLILLGQQNLWVNSCGSGSLPNV